jgi:hypothetical protein
MLAGIGILVVFGTVIVLGLLRVVPLGWLVGAIGASILGGVALWVSEKRRRTAAVKQAWLAADSGLSLEEVLRAEPWVIVRGYPAATMGSPYSAFREEAPRLRRRGYAETRMVPRPKDKPDLVFVKYAKYGWGGAPPRSLAKRIELALAGGVFVAVAAFGIIWTLMSPGTDALGTPAAISAAIGLLGGILVFVWTYVDEWL